MLRTIKSHYVGVRLIPGVITYSGGVPSLSQHAGNFGATVSDLGTGQVGLTLQDPGARILGAFASAVTDAFIATVTTFSLTSVVVQCANASGAAADGNMHVVLMVQDLQALRAEPVARDSVNVAMTNGELFVLEGNTASPSFSNNNPNARDATISKTGTGNVLISFDSAFTLPPVVIVRARTTGHRATVTTSARGSIRVKLWNGAAGDVAVDGPFSVFIFGQRSTSQSGFKRRALKNGRLKPRLIPFRISGGALQVGDHVMGLGAVGGGSYAVTFDRAFVAGPVILAGGNITGHECVNTTVSTSGATILTQDSAGSSSTSTTIVYGLAMGWMDDAVQTRF